MTQVLPPPTSSLISSLSQSKFSSMEEEDHKELQLLPSAKPTTSSSPWPSEPPVKFRSTAADDQLLQLEGQSSLDLRLSISLRRPIIGPPPPSLGNFSDPNSDQYSGGCVEALKWQAAEHLRLAAIERAYAERVREMTRREMEVAQSVFSRARHVWERAREEVEKAERMEEMAIFRQMDSTCMETEIICQSCSQKFRP